MQVPRREMGIAHDFETLDPCLSNCLNDPMNIADIAGGDAIQGCYTMAPNRKIK